MWSRFSLAHVFGDSAQIGGKTARLDSECYTTSPLKKGSVLDAKVRESLGQKGRTIKGTNHAHDYRAAKVVQRFKVIFGIRVTLPFNFIFNHTVHEAFADNSFNHIGRLAVNGGHRWWASEFSGSWEGLAVVVAFQLGHMEDRVNLHGCRKIQFVGDRGDNLGDAPGALVL